MKRYFRLRSSLSLLLLAIAMTLRYELKALRDLVSSPAAAALAIAVGVVFARLFADAALAALARFWLVRWLLLGDLFIEGVWIADTYSDARVITSGIVQVRYAGSDLAPIMTAYFPRGIRSKGETRSVSANLHIREGDLLYLNTFSSMTPPNTLVGVATGHFFKDTGRWLTNRFDGTIFYNDSLPAVRQTLTRVASGVVRRYQKAGDDWMKAMVQELGKYKEAP